MHIAILTDSPPRGTRDLGSFFILRALEKRLQGHDLVRIHRPPSADMLALLRKQDVILVAGIRPFGAAPPSPFEWGADHFKNIGRPVVPLALSVQSSELSANEIALLRHFHQSGDQISVRDAISKDFVDDLLGPGSALFTGPGSLLLRDRPLTRSEPRTLFCPGSMPEGSRALNRVNRELYEKLRLRLTTLFMAQSREDLQLGAIPGISTLYSPNFPLIHIKAIASAQSILSLRSEPVIAGIAHEVPGALVCLNDRSKSEAESLAIPHIAWTKTLESDEIMDFFDSSLANYPWEEIRRRAEYFETLVETYLSERRIGIAKTVVSVPKTTAIEPLRICCIADRNYLPFLKGFIENLLSAHGDNLELHLLALHSGIREFIQSQYPELRIVVYELNDIWERHEIGRIARRPFAHQAYASKSRLLSKALANTGRPVFYFDLDIFFFRSPGLLVDEIEGHSVLLFPNWNDYIQDSKFYGIFNAGMLGVAPGAESFLDWWSQLCLFEYNEDSSHGYFVDQGFLDMVQLYFDGVKIYKGCDHNVARWNMSSTVASFQPLGSWLPKLRNNREIITFHAALPDSLGLFELKFTWDQIVSFFAPIAWHAHSPALRHQIVQQQKNHWLALSRLEFACSLLKRLFGIRIDPWNPTLSRFFLHMRGSKVLKALAWAHYKYRIFARGARELLRRDRRAAPTSFWIELQRSLLFERPAPSPDSNEIAQVPRDKKVPGIIAEFTQPEVGVN